MFNTTPENEKEELEDLNWDGRGGGSVDHDNRILGERVGGIRY
jgi:hypothetical protein